MKYFTHKTAGMNYYYETGRYEIANYTVHHGKNKFLKNLQLNTSGQEEGEEGGEKEIESVDKVA